jgi:hypothetical protein
MKLNCLGLLLMHISIVASSVRSGRITGPEGWTVSFDARDRVKPDTTRAVGVGRSAQHAEDEKANDNQLHRDR